MPKSLVTYHFESLLIICYWFLSLSNFPLQFADLVDSLTTEFVFLVFRPEYEDCCFRLLRQYIFLEVQYQLTEKGHCLKVLVLNDFVQENLGGRFWGDFLRGHVVLYRHWFINLHQSWLLVIFGPFPAILSNITYSFNLSQYHSNLILFSGTPFSSFYSISSLFLL